MPTCCAAPSWSNSVSELPEPDEPSEEHDPPSAPGPIEPPGPGATGASFSAETPGALGAGTAEPSQPAPWLDQPEPARPLSTDAASNTSGRADEQRARFCLRCHARLNEQPPGDGSPCCARCDLPYDPANPATYHYRSMF